MAKRVFRQEDAGGGSTYAERQRGVQLTHRNQPKQLAVQQLEKAFQSSERALHENRRASYPDEYMKKNMYSKEYQNRAANADAKRKQPKSNRKTNVFDNQTRGLPLSRTLDVIRKSKKK